MPTGLLNYISMFTNIMGYWKYVLKVVVLLLLEDFFSQGLFFSHTGNEKIHDSQNAEKKKITKSFQIHQKQFLTQVHIMFKEET